MIDGYPALRDVFDSLQRLGEVEVIGTSVEDRPIHAVHLGGEGPVVCVTGGIHGLEYIGVQVALRVAELGPLPGARLVVLPVLNPDGYARTWRDRGRGRVRDLRKNARGVDLNRNFPLPYDSAAPSWLPGAGSSDPDAATYRGTGPLSEPEAQAVARWMRQYRPHSSVNCHSFMGTLIAARVWHPSDWRGYTRLGRAFRSVQPGFGYPRLATPVLDVFTGELEDWQHHVLGCWSVCVESFSLRESLAQHLRAPSGFSRFNPASPEAIAARDALAVRAMLTMALRLPSVPVRPGAAGAPLSIPDTAQPRPVGSLRSDLEGP